MNRQRNRGRGVAAALAAMCAVAVLPGQAHAAGPGKYAFDPAAKNVQGAETNVEASTLDEGVPYRSTIEPGQKLYYRVTLDDVSTAYVSAVAVPGDSGAVAHGDGITISLRDLDDSRCSSERANFGSGGYARPITAYAYRTPKEGGTTCQEGGQYDVLVERESKETSSPAAWDLELRFLQEPRLKSGASMPTAAPSGFPSATPEPLAGQPQERSGGAGYSEATGLETGQWKDSVAPGETRFYRVPVDWGQQIHTTARLANSPNGKTDFVGNALTLSLDNPAQGRVADTSLSYSGRPASTSLRPLPPVSYRNRFASSTQVNTMRFAGWYYLSVSLSPKLKESYGSEPIRLELAVQVKNKAEESPYEGDAGVFGVTERDKDTARKGQNQQQAAESGTMQVVAAAGIGTGAVLVLGLGVWALLARRRAAGAPAAAGHQPPPQQGW
ncbi:hypothetical protein CIB93_25280 [Streptomyces sp. WZ.A104]|uniref:hypothetical protein n=1 Tax=Streptomyces sp. WZ.A104 TaxID=2023771 RepID=UPI000BBC90F0|nr:hypothetical protein [Streptomyces sp. WZ.A104]PCG83346.1 hypothetical protein CIB93_25280 [Streptomyces sp. WZ.A104]